MRISLGIFFCRVWNESKMAPRILFHSSSISPLLRTTYSKQFQSIRSADCCAHKLVYIRQIKICALFCDQVTRHCDFLFGAMLILGDNFFFCLIFNLLFALFVVSVSLFPMMFPAIVQFENWCANHLGTLLSFNFLF